MKNYDYIIVGAGLAGGILARKLAEEKNKKVLIVERRNHTGGNIFDFEDEHGIRIQKYGPHVFHTNLEEVYEFISKYCEPIEYKTKCETVIDGINTPSPFNFKTIDQLYNLQEAKDLKMKLLAYYNQRETVTVVEMLEAKCEDIKKFAENLFNKDYKLYSAKQWNLDPNEIDPSVLKRVPIVLSYRDTYFDDKYEFIPKNGFSQMYKEIIDYPGIDIELGVDALKHITIDDEQKEIKWDGNNRINIIYTGAIDELFNYKYGVLPYRSLYFKYKSLKNSFQNVAIVAYPQEEGYTRITEYTKLPHQDCAGWTKIAYEYPILYDRNADVGNEPYYPVLTEDSMLKYKWYKKLSAGFSNLILCGRLADFSYYNMDQVIKRSLEVYNNMEGNVK